MILYADVLFAINFSMDFLALFITLRILHKKIYKARILISSLIGATYGVLEMIVNFNGIILELLLGVFVSFIMCLIALNEYKLKRLAGEILVFWAISALLGGIMSLMFSILNKILTQYLIEENLMSNSEYSRTRFLIIALISILISMLFVRTLKEKSSEKSVLISITIDEENFTASGLCDSGNMLTEPISGKSVILVPSNSPIGRKISTFPDYKKRYIPFATVGSGGILKGIVPNKGIINDTEKDFIIAPVDRSDFSGYDALVPTTLL